jgi:fatty-acyl-CoA synthase
MKTFAEILQDAYRQVPDQVILHLLYNQKPAEHLTYRTLLQGAAGYTRLLQDSGVEAGDVVVLILQHGSDLIYAFFGAVLHGAIPAIMPFLTEKLSPEQYRKSLTALFEITRPAAVITYPEFQAEVQRANVHNQVRSVLVSSQVTPYGELEESWTDFHGLERSVDDIVLLQHSSGTTGLQKGVALSHRAVFNQLQAYSAALHLNQDDVIVSWLPLYHDMGLIAGFLMPVLNRIPLVLLSPFDWVRAPYRLFKAVSDYHGTLSWMPNFAYNFCAAKIRPRDLEGVDLSTWRAVINCSEPMYWNSHQVFLERFAPYGLKEQALATCYAMAENVFAVSQGGIDEPVTVDRIDSHAFVSRQLALPAAGDGPSVPMLSAGRPIANTRVKVIDDKGRELPERHIGEIAIQSDCMLTGYFNRPDLTEKAFLDGWYLTGDLGYLANGEVYITGRKKDLIIVGGKNVYPQDLERLAGETPGVHAGRVVAFGVFNPETGTEDIVVVAESEEDLTDQPEKAQAIANEIRRRVTQGSDVALRFVEVVGRNWLLKTSSGKIARAANREKYLEQIRAQETAQS